MIHPAVHDADNISFGRKPCALWSLEGYSTSPYRALHPTYVTHFHSTRRNKATQLNECANKGTLLCQIYSASFTLSRISFAFWTAEDETTHQPPSRVPSPARGQMTPQWRQSGCMTNQQYSPRGSNHGPQLCTTAPIATPSTIHPLVPF